MKIKYSYLSEEFKNNNKIFKDWKKLISSTEFTLGKYVEKFEREFAKFIKAKFCISVNNGTDALILCLKSLGVEKGDEIITVTNTFYATAGAIVACGAKPVFVDCDDRFQIDIEDLKKKISKKTKVIIPVHWGGASPDIQQIVQLAKKNKLFVVEDACMGIGGKINGKAPGTFGIVNAFSMHPLKSLNVMGDGGMIATNNKRLYSWIKKFRNHGMVSRDKIEFWGQNMRMQPLQSIVASHGLKKLKKTIETRNRNAKFLDKELSKLGANVIIPKRVKGFVETFSLYMCLVKKRDGLIKFLNRKNIETKIHYPVPLHLQKASKDLGYKKGDLPVAEKQAKHLITLPVHQFLKRNELYYIVAKIKSFYKKSNKYA